MTRRWYLVSGMILGTFCGLVAGAEGWSAIPVGIAALFALSPERDSEVRRTTVEQERRKREARIPSRW